MKKTYLIELIVWLFFVHDLQPLPADERLLKVLLLRSRTP